MDKNLLTILKTKPFSICCAINNTMAAMKFKMQQYQQQCETFQHWKTYKEHNPEAQT